MHTWRIPPSSTSTWKYKRVYSPVLCVWPTGRGWGGEGKKQVCVPKMGLLLALCSKFHFSPRKFFWFWVCGWFSLGWVGPPDHPPTVDKHIADTHSSLVAHTPNRVLASAAALPHQVLCAAASRRKTYLPNTKGRWVQSWEAFPPFARRVVAVLQQLLGGCATVPHGWEYIADLFSLMLPQSDIRISHNLLPPVPTLSFVFAIQFQAIASAVQTAGPEGTTAFVWENFVQQVPAGGLLRGVGLDTFLFLTGHVPSGWGSRAIAKTGAHHKSRIQNAKIATAKARAHHKRNSTRSSITNTHREQAKSRDRTKERRAKNRAQMWHNGADQPSVTHATRTRGSLVSDMQGLMQWGESRTMGNWSGLREMDLRHADNAGRLAERPRVTAPPPPPPPPLLLLLLL